VANIAYGEPLLQNQLTAVHPQQLPRTKLLFEIYGQGRSIWDEYDGKTKSLTTGGMFKLIRSITI
jgi:hypothetical protein